MNEQSILSTIALKIIEAQEMIIGPVAVERAQTIDNLSVDWTQHKVSLGSEDSTIIDRLVDEYKKLFGEISVEVCKEAAMKAASTMTHEQLPKSLQ